MTTTSIFASEDTFQLERSVLIRVSWKSCFVFVTFDVSKHVITSLFTELSDNFSLTILSFKTTLSGQGVWVIWGLGGWVVGWLVLGLWWLRKKPMQLHQNQLWKNCLQRKSFSLKTSLHHCQMGNFYRCHQLKGMGIYMKTLDFPPIINAVDMTKL